MSKDEISELLKKSLVAWCTQCENWHGIKLLGRTYYGCACNIDAKMCMLNPLALEIRNRKKL